MWGGVVRSLLAQPKCIEGILQGIISVLPNAKQIPWSGPSSDNSTV